MLFSIWDGVIFLAYFIGVVTFAFTVAARSKTKSSADFFVASNKLPWYAVGASFIAANISTEHFIGMVGWAYLYSTAVCHWSWLNGATFTILIWVFLPFYMRGNVTTMPEFLERRYNRYCRYIYAVASLIGMVIAMLGGVMYAGGKAINAFFPDLPIPAAIIILAVAAGVYTVYGGLLSAAWADFLQFCLLMVGGTLVTLFGLYHVGGFGSLIESLPEKFILFYPSTHEAIPWTGVVAMVFTVGIWYSSANQFMVQRCLGARSEWDARMGIVMSGFSQAFLPLIIVVPGIIAFHLFQAQVSDGDQAWCYLVQQFLPTGLVGLVLAGLASAVMSTLSAITTSSATIIALDLYKPLIRPKASDHEMHQVARISGALVMVTGMVLGLIMATFSGITVFGLIQTVFFYVAPPTAAIFLGGILWRRATAAAATATLVCGFLVFLPLVRFVLFPKVPALQAYDNFMHHTFAVFVMSIVLLVVVSLLTKRKTEEELKGVIWSRSALKVSASPNGKEQSATSLVVWWGLMVVTILVLYSLAQYVGSNTWQFDAEALSYTTDSGTAVLQTKEDLDEVGFNMWTGPGQVLFTPEREGASLTIEVPNDEEGWFNLAAIVTSGPEYGRFSVLVNGEKAMIERTVTRHPQGRKRRFEQYTKRDEIFDARRIGDATADPEVPQSIASAHVVQRIRLGSFRLYAGTIRITFVPILEDGKNNQVGIDQLVISRHRDPSVANAK